ncbi:MAG: nucleotidyl transferase AbiEii/AbiGii toxin family protein [Anaerolineae bacterium]
MTTLVDPHWEMITPGCRQALDVLRDRPFIRSFYLAGGTALALQIGHRVSKDLDWFSATVLLDQADRAEIRRSLTGIGQFTITGERDTMVFSRLFGSEVSFIYQHHPLLEPTVDLDGLALASPTDIGLMKLAAIRDRGTRRDFVDVFCLREIVPLTSLIDLVGQKYADRPDFAAILARALAYFADAEQQPMPEMTRRVKWAEVKRYAEAGARYLVEQQRAQARRAGL